MTVKELINQFCEFRGKCTTDDVVALNFAYEVLAPRWISVEDRLPDEDSSVIVVCHYENVTHLFVCGYKNGEFFNCASRHEPTHWMPLPSLPSCSEFPNNCEKGGEE